MILQNLRRTFDGSFLNDVSNHPDVRPGLGGSGDVDWRPFARNIDNVLLVNEHGGWVLHKLAPGLYEAHSQFLPAGRGPQLGPLMREGFRYLFCETDCVEVVTKAPADNPGAIGLCRAAGFQHVFTREQAWPQEGGPTSISYQRLSFDRWKALDDVIASVGAMFHDKLETAKQEAGSPLPVHGHDESHDRAVGAAVLMALHGNPQKAIALYNRWAVFVGYAPISLRSEHPVMIDVGDALIGAKGDDIEVLLCRGAQQQQPLSE